MEKQLKELTPYELGESGDREAVKYLIDYLKRGDQKERRLAASAIRKLSDKYIDETRKAVPFLILNLSDDSAQLRQYCLKALYEFELKPGEVNRIKATASSVDKDYNIKSIQQIIEKYRKCSFENDILIKNNSNEQEKNIDIDLEQIKTSSTIKLKPRDKEMYFGNSNKVERYSANYSYTNHNFIIQNNFGSIEKNNKFYPVICILKNILMRGCPTLMSQFLQQKLGKVHEDPTFDYPYTLISKEVPIWFNTIKGDLKNNDYPAIIFYEEIIPKYLSDFEFIPQLMLPEVPFSDITLEINDKFINQQVDFYLPQAKLVIEIDGQSHKLDNVQQISDEERDEYLLKFGVKTIRIEAKDVKSENNILKQKIEEIEDHLEKFDEILDEYRISYSNQEQDLKYEPINKILKMTAIIRFQILILSLLEKGKLNLNDKEWRLSIVKRDIKDFEILALEDLFIWLENLCKLHKLDFNRPKIILKNYHSENSKFHKDFINIDFSIFKRWTDENEVDGEENRIYVRTDYFDKYNYFKVSTDKPVKYKIINDGIDSDEPVLEFLLNNIYGFDSFAAGQLPVIINSLRGEDTVGLLPTGGGKSLIYQFVGLLQPCISFVVAPIKSLMKDQKDNLDKRGIMNTNLINSNQDSNEKEKVQIEYGFGKYQFIWISPERFQTQKFRDQLEKINKSLSIGLAIIDEVHCLSEWGHDFRTSYLNLAKTIKKYCVDAKILGLTATASVNVLNDILVEFGIGKENVKTLQSFTRPELTFEVIRDSGVSDKLKTRNLEKLLTKLSDEDKIFEINNKDTKCGIIFTQFVNKGNLGCYKLSQYLATKFNTDVRWYSGKCPSENNLLVMENEELNLYKDEVQEDFQNNQFPLLVSTKAFGMGIDKSNIRYTIHYGIPGSLESLYQEAGRAGRDKKAAKCFVLLSEENLGEVYFNNIFALNTSVSDIQTVQKEMKFDGRDAFNNIFLWLAGVKDIEEEFSEIYSVYNAYAEPDSSKLVLGQKVGLKKNHLEKVIYKLSLIGIVDDWTIADWSERRPKLIVDFKNYNEKSVEEELFQYIRKYDKEFKIKNSSEDEDIKYYNIYNNKEISLIEKMIKILLIWQYENVAYNRRESIRTVYDQCKTNQSPEEFKAYMESYFKFSDTSFSFDYIAEKPRDFKEWFKVFYNDKGEILNRSVLKENTASLRRFLESYRFNTGLNFISGLMNLLTDSFEKEDGKQRLEEAFKSIKEYDDETKSEILKNTLQIGKFLDETNKQHLSEILLNEYQYKTIEVYDNLNDNYSLNFMLNENIERIKNAREKLL